MSSKKRAYLRQYTAAVVSSMISFCAGAAYVWPAPLLVQLQEPGAEVYLTEKQIAWMVSLVEIGNIITPLPCGYLGDLIGRKTVLLISAPLFLIAGIITLSTRSPLCLYIMRFLQGLGNGAVYSVLPLYLGEMAQPELRGIMSIFFTSFLFLGMLTTYIIGKFCTYQQLTWAITVQPVIFMILFSFMPETPQFLMLKSKKNKAIKALKWFRGAKTNESIESELEDITQEVSTGQQNDANAWKELFGTEIGIKSLSLGNLIVATQVGGGFFNIFSYTSETLNSTGAKNVDGVYVSIIFTVVTLIVIAVSASLVDVMGRRPMLLTSGVVSFFAASMSGAFFFLQENTELDLSDEQYILYSALIVLASGLNFALATLIPTLQAELFPTLTRSLASAIMATMQGSLTFVTLYIYIPIQTAAGVYINYMMYGFVLSLGTCIIYLFFPETKGKTFAQIQEMLS